MTNEYYNYLGYGVTDSNGVAKLDHDANGDPITHSYTGVGAGEIDVVASLDNPIDEGSIVSGTFPVLDTLFYDDGVGGNNTGWTKSNCTANYDSTGTEFIPTANWGNLTIPNSDYYSSMPFVIEFEVVSITGDIRVYYDSSNHYTWFNATGQYRMEVTSSGVTLKKDGTTIRTSDAPVTLTNIAITSNTTSNKCKFKEFKIYPI